MKLLKVSLPVLTLMLLTAASARAATLSVSSTADNGVGSLRERIAIANPGDTIIFTNTLSGQIITLTSGTLTLNKNLTIDGTGNSISINGNHQFIVFNCAGGTNVLTALTITNGLGLNNGGGIYNAGSGLTLNRCTLTGNSTPHNGGGIYNVTADISITPITTYTLLNQCTLRGNNASELGGGIYNFNGWVFMTNCTITANSATSGAGVQSYGDNSTETVVANSIIAGNNAGNDLNKDSSGNPNAFLSMGHNLIGNGAVTHFVATGDLTNQTTATVNLAALGNYGGPTLTMPPLPGSPAIDAGSDSAASLTIDQRGFTRKVGAHVDIGAVESGNAVPSYNYTVVTITNDFLSEFTNSGVTLRSAVAFAPTNATITFTSTLAGRTIRLTSGEIVLNRSLNLDASALPGGIQINGNNASRVFSITSLATVVLTSLTITNGNGVGASSFGLGGGIFCLGNLTLNGCRLVGNQAVTAAGALVAAFGSLTMNQTTVAGNQSPDCSAIFIQDLPAMINACTISGNSGGGDALRLQTTYGLATLKLINSTLSDNVSAVGGPSAINILSDPPGVRATAVLTNCTITGNVTGQAGQPGAIFLQSNNGSNSLAIFNSIVAGNTSGGVAADISGVLDPNSSFNLIGVGGGLTNGVKGNQVGVNNPQVAPLGSYGGPTLTRPPLSGSPAIDAATNAGLTTDQRGFPRVIGPTPDIGAVEASASTLVTTAANSGLGSLRYAVTYVDNNSTITFTNTLSGQSILLTSGEMILNKNLTIDGSTLAKGIRLNGNHASRIFTVNNGAVVALNALTLTNGFADFGGGIRNSGNLTVNQCTLTGNSAIVYGGGLINYNVLNVIECTLTGNSCGIDGAAGIHNNGLAIINQSTISGNTATHPGGCGGIANIGGAMIINATIVAGNNAPNFADLYGSISMNGDNLTSGNPLLAPLGNYGGPTPTMPPLPGSPAIDGCTSGTIFFTDQRGAARVFGTFADIGAVEGVFNPSFPLINPLRLGNGSFQFSFTNLAGASFTVFASTNVALPFNQWSNLGAPIESPAGTFQFTDPQATNNPMRFYRVSSP